jgi:tetratricopeptide (TPR) repeat protein
MSNRRETAIFTLTLAAFLFVAPFSEAQQVRPDALQLYRERRFNEAIEVTLEEIRINPARVDSYVVLGWSLLDVRRYQDTLQYMDRALRVSRFDHRLLHITAEAHYALGNGDAALRFIHEYINVAPQGRFASRLYFLMGEILLSFEEFNHADIAFTKSTLLEPRLSEGWVQAGTARERAGNAGLAAAAYQEALRIDPSLTEAQQGLLRVLE